MKKIVDKASALLLALQAGWVLALILLLWGLVAPLFTAHRFWLFKDQVSLLGGLGQLLAQQAYGLFVLIGLFSVVFPLFKLFALSVEIFSFLPQQKNQRWFGWLKAAGKWSMLDVFVVAVLVVAVKLGGAVRLELHYGLYLFAASVLMTMVLTQMDKKRKAHA